MEKITETSSATNRLFTEFHDSMIPALERMEQSLSAPFEKQTPLFESLRQEMHSVYEGITLLQEGFKILAETMASLDRKQDVLPAVIDNRGQNLEDKLGSIEGGLKALRDVTGEKSNELKSAISELSQIMEAHSSSLQKQLEESSNVGKEETEKIAQSLSFIPDNLTKYLDSNREILEAIKDAQSNIATISGAIENLTKSIVEREKKREAQHQYEAAQNHLSRGVILFYRGSLGAAEAEIRKALELHENFAEAHLNLGMIFGEKGHTDKAIEEIKKALEIEPGLEEAYNNLGVIQLKGERYEEAVASFNEAIKTGFRYPQLYLNMAKSLIALDRTGEAVDSLKKAIEIDPTNVEAQELLATYEKGT
jgi:Tfp pilus assembly protein PilF